MSEAMEKVLYRELEDLKQVIQDFLVPIYKERIRRSLKDNNEMTESDCYEALPLERQEWRQAEGKVNSFSRWIWWNTFEELRKKGELIAHHHGRGHPITYTLKGDEK